MIDNTELKQIAYLAKLTISDDAQTATIKDLNAILGLAAQFSNIDTDGIIPMAHPLHMTQRLRTDVVTEENGSDVFQSIAPAIGKKHYLVPTVIE